MAHTNPSQTARILIVDDEPANLKLLEKLLKHEGYANLELISEPGEVLPAYQRERPDLILLDLNMPEIDGFQVLESLKALNDPLRPPTIIVTGQSGREYLLQALKAGARDFVTKPFDINELMLRVRNSLEAHRNHVMLYEMQMELEGRVLERTHDLMLANEQIKAGVLTSIRSLVSLMALRNSRLTGQRREVAQLARQVGRHLGLPEAELQHLVLASLLHQLGMIGVPDAILNKPPANLTPRERELYQKHPEWAAQALSGIKELQPVAAIIRSQRECFNGLGYPDKLQGTAIAPTARILAVVTAYFSPQDAELSAAPMPPGEVRKLILKNRGAQFAPEVADALEAVLSDAQFDPDALQEE
jgi:putative two-component system response regulator